MIDFITFNWFFSLDFWENLEIKFQMKTNVCMHPLHIQGQYCMEIYLMAMNFRSSTKLLLRKFLSIYSYAY